MVVVTDLSFLGAFYTVSPNSKMMSIKEEHIGESHLLWGGFFETAVKVQEES
jgi:hypothetical protein